jgi:predicted negative regulator of RcsB-dependent stress response
MGDCYLNQNNYNHALENYEQAINIIESNTQTSKSRILNELQSLANKTKQFIENNK